MVELDYNIDISDEDFKSFIIYQVLSNGAKLDTILTALSTIQSENADTDFSTFHKIYMDSVSEIFNISINELLGVE